MHVLTLPRLTLAKRALEILPGLPSKSLSEMSSAEDRVAPTKPIEYRTSLEIKHEPGHPVVFLADARFVFVEALRCGTQNRKINVGKDRFVRALRVCVVTSDQHEGMHSVTHLPRERRGLGAGACPLGAEFFIVVSSHIVNCIVKPQCQLDFRGPHSEMLNLIQMAQAFFEMPKRVVLAMRLAVLGNDAAKQSLVGMRGAQC